MYSRLSTPRPCAQVTSSMGFTRRAAIPTTIELIDACEVNNGGCEVNAICSHDPKTYAAKCTCKTGYKNVGSPSNVICKGRIRLIIEIGK